MVMGHMPLVFWMSEYLFEAQTYFMLHIHQQVADTERV